MKTAHKALLEAIAAQLTAAPALAGGRVEVGSRRPMPQAVTSQVFVGMDDAPSIGANLGATALQWTTRVIVHCVARDSAAASAEDAADSLLEQVHARIMDDPSLGGAAMKTTVAGLAWRNEEEAEQGVAACQALFEVLHRTPRHSIAAP